MKEIDPFQEPTPDNLAEWLAQVLQNLSPEGRGELVDQAEAPRSGEKPASDPREMEELLQKFAHAMDRLEVLPQDRLALVLSSLDILLTHWEAKGLSAEDPWEDAVATYLAALWEQLSIVMEAMDAPMSTAN